MRSSMRDASISKHVIDASAALSWILGDERDEFALVIAQKMAAEGVIAPTLWRYEVTNALLSAQRRGRLDPADVRQTIEDVAALDVELLGPAEEFGAEIVLAQRFGLSIYDSAYLELAFRKNVPLITRDEKLRSAASELGLLWSPS